MGTPSPSAAALAALLVLLGWSCSISPGSSPVIESVEPSWATAGVATEIEISGEGFELDASRDVSCGGSPLVLEDEFEGAIGDTDLKDVVWIDEQTLVARVPATLGIGVHDLTVMTPAGDSVTLPEAFEVRDPGGGSDSDVDSDVDSDTSTEIGDGVECESAIMIDVFPFTWAGAWADFYSSFVPTNACGTGSSDIWFSVQIPGGGVTMRVTELSDTDVLVRHVASCTDWTCVDYTDWPEYLDIPGAPSAETVYVVVTEIDAYYHPDGEVLFEIIE